MATGPTPLAGGSAASARRRDSLWDAGAEVYATLGPDARVHYLPVSGLPLVDAVGAIARGQRASIIVLPQSVAGDIGRLVADVTCPIAIAPYGHRFARAFAPRHVAVASQGARAAELRAAAELLLPACEGGFVDPSAHADLLVVAGVDAEQLRQAACPVLVIGDRALAPLTAAHPPR
jgi:hypothetical protein